MTQEVGNQPAGRMTIMALPEQLRGQGWPEPQELEIRLAGELVAYGLITRLALQRLITRCADPTCPSHSDGPESLRLEVEIAPALEATA